MLKARKNQSVVEYVAHVLLEHHVHLPEAGQCGQWGEWGKERKKVRKTTPFIDKSQLKTTRRRVIFFPNPIKVIDLGDFITVSVTKTCGDSTSNNCTYFQNSGYPSTYDSVGSCQLTVNKCDSSVCQLR